MNIFVAKLNFRTTSEALQDLFAQYGEVKSCKVITDRDTGKSKGYAFVEMFSEDAGLAAIASLNESEFEAQTIVVKKAEDRQPSSFNNNRGGGGGGGGFKPRSSSNSFRPRRDD
jgi:RNA recognition motif-containing protein